MSTNAYPPLQYQNRQYNIIFQRGRCLNVPLHGASPHRLPLYREQSIATGLFPPHNCMDSHGHPLLHYIHQLLIRASPDSGWDRQIFNGKDQMQKEES
jgi:hypothetical protein